MTTALLSSKFYFPPQRPELVSRPRLIERLNAGIRGKLTLVSAPAGFGKTTLVSEWVRGCGRPIAWLSLDEKDNDLARFLTYLIAALQRIDGGVGVDIQAALNESQSPQFEILLTKLISEIETSPDPSIMVLDDYHLIDSKPIHDALNFLVEYLPPAMHLVISGRTDPPLPISRLRVRRDINEIRTPDLRFTKAEVAAFLNDLMGFDLSSEDIAALESRTEGWIASLQLAALSMNGRDDRRDFISAFSGSHRYVIDYLVDEVMSRQPAEVQTFLRRTSILERFCALLCDEIVSGEKKNGTEIINYLDRSNLFIIPLDDRREWFRYHHLFADFLRQRLRENEPKRIPELHHRASQWYECEGLVDEAIQHALFAGDLDAAIRLVDGIAADLVVRRESNKLIKLVNQLPADRCQDYPMLCIWHAWALFFLGQLDAVEPILAVAEANRGQAPGIPITGYVTTVRAYLANHRGDLYKAIDLTEQALEEMSGFSSDKKTLIFRGSAVIWLGVNHRHLGNLDKAGRLFLEAAAINQEAGNIYAALASYEQLAELAVIRGRLHEALDIYRSGLEVARNWNDQKGNPKGALIVAGILHLGLGEVLYQRNDLVGAALHLQRADELFELGELTSRMHSYRMLAYLKQAEGDFGAPSKLLSKARAIREAVNIRQSNTSNQPSLDQLGIMLSRAQPEMAHLLTDVSSRLETLGLKSNDEVNFSAQADYSRESEYSDLARALIALDRSAEAHSLLERLLEAARSMERQGDEIRYQALIALAHHALGDRPAALDSLGQALALAEPQGYIRLFVDEGAPMAELLLLSISQGFSSDYPGELLAAFPEDLRNAVEFDLVPAATAQALNRSASAKSMFYG
ncbi:tetratricopeptide repeat protein [Chloroflexota bacterium]